MNGLETLRRANPGDRDGFAATVEIATELVRGRIATDAAAPSPLRRRRSLRVSAIGVALAAVLAGVVVLTGGSPEGGSGTESALAAVRRAATVTAAVAERSGTATVRMTHDGEAWAAATIRWQDEDLAVTRDAHTRPAKAGSRLVVVDGMLYGIDPVDGGWVEMGPSSSIDPDSGTTPDEVLAAVREDVGGTTVRRITDGMRGLTTSRLADGSTVYRGSVPAGLVARETGFKEGQALRVLPFGYVANGAAADPTAALDATLTIGGNGIVRELAVRWEGWTYAVTYSDLGATTVSVPRDARPFDRKVR